MLALASRFIVKRKIMDTNPVYITLSNAMRIVIMSNLSKIEIKKRLYDRPINYFNRLEKNQLLSIKELFRDPEHYFSVIYSPVKVAKKSRFVYMGHPPSFHENDLCKRLSSNYRNYRIPDDIIEQGKANDFRKWFKSVEGLYNQNPDTFVARLYARWGILTNVKSINKENSGTTQFLNFNLKEIQIEIDALLTKAEQFKNESKKQAKILNSFSKLSYMGLSEDKIKRNFTGYSDDKVKNILRVFHLEYKIPLRELLVHYYRLVLNPKLAMEGDILTLLGFSPCGSCFEMDMLN
jgi:hypothetical protein